jgi:hypothetical protein
MQHYKLADRELPSAHITRNRNLVKVYPNNTIYLKNWETFEIHIENPTLYDVLAKVWLNGNPISNGGISIPLKSNIYLERFIDEPNKFTFNSYESVLQGGLVQIEFYKQKPKSLTYFTHSAYTPSTSNDETISTSNLINDSRITYTSNVSTDENSRIDGGVSSQLFVPYYDDFEDFPLNAVTYHIRPIHTNESPTTNLDEPIDVNEIRYYCPECGYRIRKSSWKYCPKCGEKL